MEPVCTQCHTTVRPTDFFCYNCGKNLKEKPFSISLTTQLLYYAGSVLLPPFGIIWGLRYLKQTDTVAKRVGLICIVLTIVSLVVMTIWTMKIMSGIIVQLNGVQGF